MMTNNGNNNKPSQWHEIENLLGSKLPALPTSKQMELLKDTSWIEGYVQNILNKTMPQNGMQKVTQSNSKAEVFETHYHVIVKTPISYEVNPAVKVRPDLIKIEGQLDNKKNQLIRLPCLVVPSTAKATYKEGILQIKIRKKKLNKTYREVSIRYI
ncbi:hypothetical protein GC093_08950 [Paenibacillus sp. LMG 31456]|uniref:Hsp20/alpha crystallin family protein n=1 Tax=Paenibacillus foliorum TaxID=2654974 RepID=A0A972GMB8_9BACL|nr:Hsp20/alpha crystallin family protein [Paenibacillus foliorum]NOU93342.1 hypothetical protein [Paenibacillus foliorum]